MKGETERMRTEGQNKEKVQIFKMIAGITCHVNSR